MKKKANLQVTCEHLFVYICVLRVEHLGGHQVATNERELKKC